VRVCSEPGCPELVDKGKCEAHRLAARKRSDRSRPSSSQRGYDAKWRRTRAAFLRAHPICEDPSGCIERATDVDHIDGLGPNGPRGHDPTNLKALCHPHHSQKTYRSEGGGFR
jgi:5-methylcytosine-specific restriction protein A